MNVEVLYFEGCPNHLPAVERVQAVLREEGISGQVRQVEVPDSLSSEQRKILEEFARVSGDTDQPMSKGFFEKAKKFF